MATNEPNEPKVSRTPDTEDDTTRRGVYVSDDTWRAAKVYAASQDISVSKVFELAVLKFLSEKQSPTSAQPPQTVRDLKRAVPSITEPPKARRDEQ